MAEAGGGGGDDKKKKMCDDCEKRKYTTICKECDRKMCNGCLTGDMCQMCQEHLCCLGDNCEIAIHSSGKHCYCWDCILEAMTLLEKKNDAEKTKKEDKQ
jgi:hypothetical protein